MILFYKSVYMVLNHCNLIVLSVIVVAVGGYARFGIMVCMHYVHM